jgi:hypothetical protein
MLKTYLKLSSRSAAVLTAACAVVFGAGTAARAGTYANITIDGSYSDWATVPVAVTDPVGDGDPIDFGAIQIANDANNIYLHVHYNTAVNPNAGPSTFLAFDTDNNVNTGFDIYGLHTVGSEAGYQNDFPFDQRGGFNSGGISGAALISPYATSTTDQEYAIPRNATYTSDGQPVFANNSFTLMLWTDSGVVADTTAGIPYSFAIADTVPNWNLVGSGDWNVAGNWSSGTVPNGIGATAKLHGAITGPSTVYTNAGVVVGTLSFDNANTYVVAGAGSLTLDVASGSAEINVAQGAQKINLPLALNDSTSVDVAAGAGLTIGDPLTLASGVTMAKNGAGSLTVLSTIHAAGPATIKVNGGVANFDAANNDPNVSINVDPATLNVGANQTLGAVTLDLGGNTLNVGRDSTGSTVSARLNATAMHVTGGGAANVLNQPLAGNTVAISGSLDIQSGSKLVRQGAGVLKVGAMSIASTGQLDMTDGRAIVDYSGASPITALRAQLQSGFAGGSWNGNGINSSTAAAASSSPHKTAIGYAEASALGIGSFGGEAVDGSAVVMRYTASGDANLDHTVDLTDFTFLAANFNGTNKTWLQGDFNYDGTVDLTDFTFLAANFNYTVPASDASLGAAVPEPTAIGAMCAMALLSARRRRTK